MYKVIKGLIAQFNPNYKEIMKKIKSLKEWDGGPKIIASGPDRDGKFWWPGFQPIPAQAKASG
jgi:hypothetical protein